MDIYKMMKLLSDQSRMKILFIIFKRPSYVQDIVDVSELSQANVSKHLKKLRELGLVDNICIGNKVKYQINSQFNDECLIFQPLMNMYTQHPDGLELLVKIDNLK